MAFKVHYKSSVEHDLRKLGRPTAKRLLSKLERVLSVNPRAGEPLRGEFQGLFGVRIGEHRVIYSKMPEGVLALRIGHRREVYR